MNVILIGRGRRTSATWLTMHGCTGHLDHNEMKKMQGSVRVNSHQA